MSTKKYDFSLGYPKRDGFKPGYGERLKYIKYPRRKGDHHSNYRWFAADILQREDGTFYLGEEVPGLTHVMRHRDDLMKACQIHNNFEFGEGNWEHIVAQAFAGA